MEKVQTYSLVQYGADKRKMIEDQLALNSSGNKALNDSVVNTIRPVDRELLQTSQQLLPVESSMSVLRRHIPKQEEIDKVVKILQSKVLHQLQLPLNAQDLVQEYKHSLRFKDIYLYLTAGKLPGNIQAQKCIRAEAMNYVGIEDLLFRMDFRRPNDPIEDQLLLVIPEKYEPIIFNIYHASMFAGHQGPWKTFLTIRKKFFIHNLLNKLKRYIEACHTCLRSKAKCNINRPFYGRIPLDYMPMSYLSADIKYMPKGFSGFDYLLEQHVNIPISQWLFQ